MVVIVVHEARECVSGRASEDVWMANSTINAVF
jgi:hypothetical protein